MEARDLVSALRKGWLAILVAFIAGAAIWGGLGSLETPQYRATSALFFSLRGGVSATDLNQGAVYTQSQMASFQQLATMPIVLDPVAKRLGMTERDVAKAVTVKSSASSVILEVTAQAPDPKSAATIANEVAAQVVTVVGQVADKDAKGQASVGATVVRQARPPEFQSSPNKKKLAMLGGAAGLIVGVVFALLRQLLDTRLRSREEVEKHLPNTPTVGTISLVRRGAQTRFKAGKRAQLRVRLSEGGLASEEVRALRTNLDFVIRTRPIVVVTSAQKGEGKTTVCCALAEAMGETGKKVLLIDADMRRPSTSDYFGVVNGVGLADVLIGRSQLQEAIQPVADNVNLLVAGSPAPNPSELAASREMADLLAEQQKAYDVVLVDTPPLLPVTDAAVIARVAGGALIVVDSSKQHRGNVIEVIKRLDAAGASTLGVVLNRVAPRRASNYGYSSKVPLPDTKVSPRSVSEAASTDASSGGNQ